MIMRAGFKTWLRALSASGAVLAVSALSALAVEVSLEENRAERGNIGYVDMQLLFREFPETQKAKENFEEVVRQAEDQVNLRKTELIALRGELSQLRAQKAVLTKGPMEPAETEEPRPDEVRPAPLPVALPSPPIASSSSVAAVSLSSGAVVSVSSGAAVAISSDAAVDISSLIARGSEIAVSTAVPALAVSTRTEPVPQSAAKIPAAPAIPNLPGLSAETPAAPVQAKPAGESGPLAELNRQIAEKAKTLSTKEEEFETYQTQVEKNLLELENRRTEILLGKIYGVVQTVAREEGISVVVDKNQILFGQKAVDLTSKVLQKLKSL